MKRVGRGLPARHGKTILRCLGKTEWDSLRQETGAEIEISAERNRVLAAP